MKKLSKQNGITLIALIITIIIMLILVGVSIQVVIDSGLIGAARRAVEQTKAAYEQEGNLGAIQIGDETYNSIGEYLQTLCSHEFGEWTVIKEATYTEAGERNRTCGKCGIKQTEYPNMLVCAEHTYTETDWVVDTAATCTAVGEKHVVCTTCGTEVKEEIAIDRVNGHNFEDGICTICGAENLPVGAGTRYAQTGEYSDGTKTAVIPAGFTVSGIKNETTIDNGLVIYEIPDEDLKDPSFSWTADGDDAGTIPDVLENYNQFIWIPVGEINSMIMCQTHATTATLTYNENSEKLECDKCTEAGITDTDFCGKLYKTVTGDPGVDLDLTGQTYNPTGGLSEPAVLTSEEHGDGYILPTSGNTTRGAYFLYTILGIENTDKNLSTTADWYTNKTIANEVRDNFGKLMQERFNKMATSVAKNGGFYVGRYESSLNGEIAESKNNKAPMKNINWYQMYKYEYNYSKETDTTLGVVSEMIWGCQWDQIMIFLSSKTEDDAGNNFSILSGASARHNSSGVKNTALNANDKIANLYDLEGNCYEWSQEASDTRDRVYRGGLYYYRESVSYRSDTHPFNPNTLLSSRAALYIK